MAAPSRSATKAPATTTASSPPCSIASPPASPCSPITPGLSASTKKTRKATTPVPPSRTPPTPRGTTAPAAPITAISKTSHSSLKAACPSGTTSSALSSTAGKSLPLAQILSGSPFTVTSGVDNSFTATGNDRPNLVPGVPVYLNQPIHNGSGAANEGFLNIAAFSQVCPSGSTALTCANYGTFGNIGRNTFRGRPSYRFDAQLSRVFPIRESLNAVFRFECFNVLNHPNFSNPATNLSSASSFGLTTSTSNSSRLFQASAKINF